VWSAASLALAGKYREATDVSRSAMHNVEPALRRITGEVKIDVKRLYEAIVKAVAKLLQKLGEHWRVLALVAAAVVAGILTWMAARQILAVVDMARFVKLAAGGFFGVAAVKEDKRATIEELRKVVEKVRELEAQAVRHSPLFGPWQLPEGAREVGEALIDKVRAFAKLKGLGKGAEGEFVKLSAATGSGISAFNALGDEKIAKAAEEATSKIQRVVEEAWAAVRPTVAIASKALAKAEPVPEPVGLADEEFKRAFNVRAANDRRLVYFVYSVGDVEYGAVKARGVRAVAFMGGKKTLRIEVLAEGVKGLAAERIKALGGEWVRLATFEVNMESGVVHLIQRVRISAQVEVEPVLAKQLPALVLTDAGAGGEYLESPDPTLHLLYALAVGEAEVRVARVVFTEAGPTLHLESRAPVERVNWPYEGVRRELSELGVVVRVRELRRTAKATAAEIIGEYAGEVKRIAKEARGVEELRVKLVQLFDEAMKKAAEEYRRKGSKEALWRAVGAAVAKKFFAENVDDPVWWTLLLLGDGIVRPRDHEVGFSAVPAEAAKAVMYIFVRVMGVPLEVRREGEGAVLSRNVSRAAVEELFKRLEEAKVGDASVLKLLTAAAEWWLGMGTGGSNPPKLLSLLTFRELTAGEVGERLRAWLSYGAVIEHVPEKVEEWLDGVYRVSVEPSRNALSSAMSFDVYLERGGVRFRLHTDFTDFRLFCESCREAAKDDLRAVAKTLDVKPKWTGNALDLPAEVGWPIFLRLWRKYNTSLPVKDGDRELLRIEVLEARADGTAKFRLWYHKWRETRQDKPYVDFEVEPYPRKDDRVRFVSRIYANVAEGILREHLAEIAELLKREGVEGVSLKGNGKELQFTGAFRDSILRRLAVKPEYPPGKPPTVKHLGSFRFKIGDKEAEFGKKVVGKTREFYAELKFPSRVEAEDFAKSLKAIGVDAKVAGSEDVGYTVKLDSDAFFGLLAATNATPPGLTLLYLSEDLHVYAAVEGNRMRFYFAVRHEGVWRAVEGLYDEKALVVDLWRKEREILEAIRGAVAKALEQLAPKKLGHPARVGEPKEVKNEKGNVRGYYLSLYGPHLKPFLEHAAETVKAEPAEVRLKGRRIVVEVGGVKAEVEFKLLKGSEADFLLAQDVAQTLVLYKSLREVGVPVEITPKGVKVYVETMWALVATAVERDMPSALPAEVMPGVELMKAHSAGGVKMYAFRVSEEGTHYYFAVKTEKGWKATGGKKSGKVVQIIGEATRVVADAINAIYSKMGVNRRVEVKLHKNGTPYIRLTNVDLELLGLKRP